MPEGMLQARNPPEQTLLEREVSRSSASQPQPSEMPNPSFESGAHGRTPHPTLSNLSEADISQQLQGFLPSPQESYSSTRDYAVHESSHECEVPDSNDMSIPSEDQAQNVLADFARSSPPDLEPACNDTTGGTTDNFAIHPSLQSKPAKFAPAGESPAEVEVHGPGSILSICSNSGIQWVSERIGGSDFKLSAASLASFVARSLKLHHSLHLERVPEPDLETAMKYVQVFSEESIEGTIHLIHRPSFEARLRAHFEIEEKIEVDPAWYALRNIIYAFGSRLSFRDSRENGWMEAQIDGWQYFQNALSVHSDLIYSWSSILAVQALFFMALYVEGVGAPKLEYMLVSNAVRLAQAKGLYTTPSTPWNISESELQSRNLLFWAIYVYEKHISFRSRRPSIIDDDEIECPLPIYPSDINPSRAEFFTHVIYHAQITSSVIKSLLSVKSRHKAPSLKVKIVQDLDARLQSWVDNLPNYLKPAGVLDMCNLPPGIIPEHKIFIQFSYYGTLSAIHSVFACPWNLPALDISQDDVVRNQIELSTFAAADAARNTILTTRSIKVDAAAPVWLTFLFPFMGMLNLFTHVLKSPLLPSVPADIDLLDMAAGYFGYLGFSTLSQVSVYFVKEIPRWARTAVERARQGQATTGNDLSSATVSTSFNQELETLFDFANLARYDFGSNDWHNFFQTI